MLWFLAWCFGGILTVGVRVSLTLLPELGIFCLLLAALPSLDMRIYIWYYCILLSHVQLMPLGGLFFSGGKDR